MEKMMAVILMSVFMFGLLGCAGGIDFSQVSPDAKDFHPRTIAVLPPIVGEFESSRDTVGDVISQQLRKSGRFDTVLGAETIKIKIAKSNELANDIADYYQKLNTLGVSDPYLAAKLGEIFSADALFIAYVTSWGYERMEGGNVARVGLGIKLVSTSKGTMMWKAGHELVEGYWIFKPELDDLVKELLDMLMEEMPN
jgi:hypothetical protein